MSFLKGWLNIGNTNSSVKSGAVDWLSEGTEKYFGYENFGNTCYCNSVLQALYFCRPFRECVIAYSPINAINAILKQHHSPSLDNVNSLSVTSSLPNITSIGNSLSSNSNGHGHQKSRSTTAAKTGGNCNIASSDPPKQKLPINDANLRNREESSTQSVSKSTPPELLNLAESMGKEENLLGCLQEVFVKVTNQKKRTGSIGPSAFVTRLKKENELFRSTMHQDAHEFLNYTLNNIAEILLRQQRELRKGLDLDGPISSEDQSAAHGEQQITPPLSSWVHEIFEGTLTNETKCLTCETVTSRNESFLDLSIDIESNTSITSCLRNFSSRETLNGKNKFFCDKCGGLQEAEKRMKIKRLPNVLAVHLKRFKYMERLQRHAKLSYRVVFPTELRLFNTCDDTLNPDRLYNLFAVVVHIGTGPHHGHYVTIVKPHSQWLLCDDETVEPIDESEVWKIVGGEVEDGVPPAGGGIGPAAMGTGYIFFYQAEDIDVADIKQRTCGVVDPRAMGVTGNLGSTRDVIDATESSVSSSNANANSRPSEWSAWYNFGGFRSKEKKEKEKEREKEREKDKEKGKETQRTE